MAGKKSVLLFESARRGTAEEVRRLLASGADAKAPDGFGSTALMWAASNGHADCVELLLPVSDVHALDNDGRTAARWAEFRGYGELSAWLDGFERSMSERSSLEDPLLAASKAARRGL